MPYPFKFLGSVPTNSLTRQGNFYMGVNQGGYGSTTATSFRNGQSPNVGGYVVYKDSGTNNPFMYILNSDAELIAFANQSSLGNAFFQLIIMQTAAIFYTDVPPIITSGLTCYCDAGFLMSYANGANSGWGDVSIGSNYVAMINSPTFNPSYYSSNFTLNGVNNYFNCGAVFDYTSGSFTISYWIYLTSLTTSSPGQGPVIIYKGAYQVNGYYDQLNADGSISFITNTAGANVFSNTAAGTISTGNIYNITYVRESSSVRIYVNGVDVTSTAGTHVNPVSSASDFLIGTYNTSFYANVKIYTFANYTRALSSTEVLRNYNNGLLRFIPETTTTLWLDSENTNTRITTPTIAYDRGINRTNANLMNSLGLAHRDAGTSFSFDGVSNYIDCGSLANLASGSTNLTVSLWFKITSTPAGANTMIKFGADSSGWLIGVSTGIYFQLYTTSTNFIGGGYSVSLNVWNNVTFTFNGPTYTLYINGSSVYSNTTTSGSIVNGGSTTVNIGRDGSTNTNYFAGKMSIVRIFNSTLTANDVLNIYKSGKPRHNL